MHQPFHAAYRAALSVLLPTECGACGAPDFAVCPSCRARVRSSPVAYPLRCDDVLLTVWCALDYSGAARDLLVALKEKNRTDVAGVLAPPLATAVRAACASVPASEGIADVTRRDALELLTVPSSRASLRARGYDPVRMLLRRIPEAPKPADVLRHVRQPRDQARLGADERQRNLGHSISARRDLTGRRFLLVDDVLTSGATLREVHRAVAEAGGEVIVAAALAHTARRYPATRPT